MADIASQKYRGASLGSKSTFLHPAFGCYQYDRFGLSAASMERS